MRNTAAHPSTQQLFDKVHELFVCILEIMSGQDTGTTDDGFTVSTSTSTSRTANGVKSS